jgi:[protein-PII] uridylyltransferase
MILVSTPRVQPLGASVPLPEGGVKPAALGSLARDFVLAVRAELEARHAAGVGGLAGVAAYTEAIDRLVRFVFEAARGNAVARNPRLHERYTLVAQGGYGRGELNAYSDIDLLFLYPWKITPHIETVIEVILYALWDAGLTVGHAVRNERECLGMAARDVKVKTALLDARHVAGDEALYSSFDDTMVRELWTGDQAHFIREKLAERTSRHARAGRSVRLLQPELKEGQGGLRDLHTAMWMAKARFRARNMQQLVPLGVLGERDLVGLEEALDFLWRLRNMIHFATKRHEDRLGFELQDLLAPRLGFGEGQAGLERFMRTYYKYAAFVHGLSQRLIDRCSRPAEPHRAATPPLRVIGDGLRIRGAQLSLAGRDVLEPRPARVVEIFREAQRHDVTLAPQAETLVRDAVVLLGTEAVRREAAPWFREILQAQHGVADTLDAMHRLGVLGAILPEFAHLDCLVSHDPYHTYTVDQHTLLAVREIEDLAQGRYERAEPELTRLVREISQLDLAYLGMLCHDIGKGFGGNHAVRGVPRMRGVTDRLGLDDDEAAAATFLVRHHLLMSMLAQRRDIGDPELVRDFAATVGSTENLQRLTVVTFADMRAVAPGVWNEWRGGLVRELYRRTFDVLHRGERALPDDTARRARIRARAIAHAPVSEAARLAAFLDRMPASYVLGTPEGLFRMHAGALREYDARRTAGEDPAFAITRNVTPRGIAEVAICALDRPGLFATFAGALAAHGMDVLSARIATTDDGLALDAFRIQWGSERDEDAWDRLRATLGRILDGTMQPERLVRAAPAWRRAGRRTPTLVQIDNEVSSTRSVIDVETDDRPGLLFTITSTLFHLGLDVHLAKINTVGDRALDVLYVTNGAGRKITEPAQVAAIERTLHDAVAPEPRAPRPEVGAAG